MGDYLAQEFKEWNPEKHLYGKIRFFALAPQPPLPQQCRLVI